MRGGRGDLESGPDGRTFTKAGMREGLEAILRRPHHVRINAPRLEEVAQRIPGSIASHWIDRYRETDEHYQHNLPPLPIDLTDRDLLQWAMVSASQGWLIWERTADGDVIPFTVHVEGTRYVGGSGLEACHARAIRRGRDILDPDVLTAYTMADVEDHYRDERTGRVTLQLLEHRLRKFRAVGQALQAAGGHFVHVLEQAGGYLYREDGKGLVQILQTRFGEVFDDWPFAKRVHVLIGGLVERSRTRPLAPDLDRLLRFHDFASTEGGADYYRPLWFIRVGIFDISDEFKTKLRRRELIEPGSPMELEFRAATVEVMRRLAERVGSWPDSLGAIALETHGHPYLRCRRCRVGIAEEALPCPYRPVCKATHEDRDLMPCAWPLVLTTDY
jgi:Queuosine salvage protein